jgi:hypothetical protein
MNNVPIFLCRWHVLKAWRLCATKKIKDVEMRATILCDLHDVMYMSMNHNESIEAFKKHARQKVKQFKNHLVMNGQVIFGLIIGMDLNVEGWLPCLWTHGILWMMGTLMMVIMSLLKLRKG